MNLRAQDVIHSAFIPNLRVQMNAVPGMPTSQVFTPIVTTKEMRARLQKEHPNDDIYNDWNYMMLCNKICGASHYMMKMVVIVETKEEYDAWLKTLKAPYKMDNAPATTAADSTSNKTTASN
jgi:cytochrome c oxidase subunit 2